MARTDPRPHYGTKRRVRTNGYIDIYEPAHPLARADGYVMEHRKVAWDAGLLTDETMQVHHRNGDRADNRLSNLQPIAIDEHSLHHAEDRGTVVNQFGEWRVKPRNERASRVQRKPERRCAECGTTFRARSDARYCGSPCRIRSWKRAQAA